MSRFLVVSEKISIVQYPSIVQSYYATLWNEESFRKVPMTTKTLKMNKLEIAR